MADGMSQDEFRGQLRGLLGETYYGWSTIATAFARKLDEMTNLVEPFSKVEDASSKLAKAVGLSARDIQASAERLVAFNKNISLSRSYGISNEQVYKMTETLMNSLQRNVAIDQFGALQRNEKGEMVNKPFENSELEYLVAARSIFGDETVGNIVGGFDRVGKSMLSAAKATGKLYKEAGKYGINLSKYAQNFVSNLQMVQMYNFRNGVDGLREMARKATEIRQDMQQVANFAEKVGTVTGAVETAANLQVLGGSFAALSDPMAMLNESLTDMNGLQNRLIEMTNGAATYNSTTHEIEMDSVSKILMRRAAESMGVNPENLFDQAFAQARKNEIERQVKVNGIGGVSDELIRLLSNVGEIDSESGIAGATIDGRFRTIGEIAANDSLQKQLIQQNQTEGEDIKEIAKAVMSIRDHVAGGKAQLENEMAYNKIKPGANGVSSWDAVVDYVINHFTDGLTDAIGAVSFPIENISNQITAAWESAKADIFVPLRFLDDPEKRGASLSEAIARNIGDGPIATALNNIFTSAATTLDKVIVDLNEYAKESTNGQVDIFKNYQDDGSAVFAEALREVSTGQRNNPSVATASRDIAREVESFSRTGSRETIQAAQRRGETQFAGNSMAQTLRENPTPENVITALEGIFGEAFSIAGTEANNGFNITVSRESIPGQEVSAPANENTTERRTNAGGGEYTINLTGNLQMNVNGDKGKIGTIEFAKMLENNQGFMRELANMLSGAIEEIERRNGNSGS